jgi:hypothetical protein
MISQGVKNANLQVLNPPNAKYQVKDVWTTIDGKWYTSDSPYSIPQWAIDDYAVPNELGGAQNLYVRVLDKNGNPDFSKRVHWQAFGSNDASRQMNPKYAFADIPVWSIYYPDQGQTGGWQHGVDGTYYLEGGGLPYGNHMSVFLVLEPKNSMQPPPIPPLPPIDPDAHSIDVWLPHSKTTVHVHRNGYEFVLVTSR